jgi:peptide/nickel transport system permease protein
VLGLLIRRLFSLVIVMFTVAVIVFSLMYFAPGSPASILLGPDATQEDVERLTHRLGLDQPLPIQLARWLGTVLQGDLGQSLFLRRPVLEVIMQRVEPTILLTLIGLVIAVGLGVPAGIISAVNHGRPLDQSLAIVAIIGISIPEFWLAINLMLLLGQYAQWFPVSGYVPLSQDPVQSLRSLFLPGLAIGLVQMALVSRITRSAMLDVLKQDYVRTARAKGLRERAVVNKHALRNAVIQIVTVIGIVFAILLSGAVVVELVFNLPGMGRLLIDSVLRRDYPVIQGIALLVAAVSVLVNLLTDLTYVVLNPQIRYD